MNEAHLDGTDDERDAVNKILSNRIDITFTKDPIFRASMVTQVNVNKQILQDNSQATVKTVVEWRISLLIVARKREKVGERQKEKDTERPG